MSLSELEAERDADLAYSLQDRPGFDPFEMLGRECEVENEIERRRAGPQLVRKPKGDYDDETDD